MNAKVQKIPGPDHPITVEHNPARVVVKIGDTVIADSVNSLRLQEASYPPIHYIPRKDVNMSLLERTDHGSYCPYKGEASYYSIPAGGDRSRNAVWSYETPYDAVGGIREHVAFYPDRVDSIEELASPEAGQF